MKSPAKTPYWDVQQGGRGLEHKNHMITCLIEGMKRYVVKPVNYDKVRKVTREKMRILPSSRAAWRKPLENIPVLILTSQRASSSKYPFYHLICPRH